MTQSISDLPTFNLKVVLQETGIKPDTIRAWERRYGLPEPNRTTGGHRLYSQRDIEMIKWLMSRQDEGLSISRAVHLWRNVESEGRDPLNEETFQVVNVTPSNVDFAAGAAVDEIRQSWVEACLVFDEARAEATLTQAFALYPVEVACVKVLQKGISQIGQRWFQGQISVQQEHFASSLAIRKIDSLISASPSPYQKEKVVVACPPEEDHTFSALLVTLLLRQRGWPVIYLGANVPVAELRETIEKLKPSILILPAQQLSTAARLAEVAWEIQDQVAIAFGGLIFNLVPAIRSRVPGYFIGEKLEQAALTIEHLIRQRPPRSETLAVSIEYQEALAHFRDQKAAIEARVWERLSGNGIERKHLVIANHCLNQNIEAALALGDLSILAHEINWLEEFLKNHEMPVNRLSHFLQTYVFAADEKLDGRGQIIINWLTETTGSEKSRQ